MKKVESPEDFSGLPVQCELTVFVGIEGISDQSVCR